MDNHDETAPVEDHSRQQAGPISYLLVALSAFVPLILALMFFAGFGYLWLQKGVFEWKPLGLGFVFLLSSAIRIYQIKRFRRR